jgi:hypothetical protein
MEPGGSLPSLQDVATGPYPGPYESSPHPHTLFAQSFVLILSSRLCLGLPGGLGSLSD